MGNFFARRGAKDINEFNQSCAALIGIAQGVLADRLLNDAEVRFLREWLKNAETLREEWPGNVIYQRVSGALADGVISEDERSHLVETLQKLVGGELEDLAASTHVSGLMLDDVKQIEFQGRRFCLTGDFVYAPRKVCIQATEERGGSVTGSVSSRTDYVIVGGLGSSEWKHGSFGTKIERAMQEKERPQARIVIAHEDVWAASLSLA